MRKKAQGLSITTIIVAAIALIVLVVLIAIFTGRLGGFSQGLSETITCKNSCAAFNMDSQNTGSESICNNKENSRLVPGDFSDAKDNCCCTPRS